MIDNTSTTDTDPQRFGDVMAHEVAKLAYQRYGLSLVVGFDNVVGLPTYRLINAHADTP